MKLLDNNTPQVKFENIHELIIELMLTNKSELVQLNEYGAIATNNEATNIYLYCLINICPIYTTGGCGIRLKLIVI